MKTFTNPYEHVDKQDNFVLLQSHVDPGDYNFIRCIRPKTGTVRTVMNLLWQKLVNSLKENGITDFSRCSDFESFVANIVFIDGRPDPSRPPEGRVAAGKSPRRRQAVNG